MAWPEEAGSLGVIRAVDRPSTPPAVGSSRLLLCPPDRPPVWLIGRSRSSTASRVVTARSRVLAPHSSPLAPRLVTAARVAVGRPAFSAARSRSNGNAAGRSRYYHDARGLYRIFNEACYRFYRSDTSPPVETDTPFATNAGLPHTPSDTYADGTWYLSASYYNGILDSGFLPLGPNGETYLRLDLSGGEEVTSPPAGPVDWRIEQTAGGVVRVLGLYYQADSTLRADDWSLAYTTNGAAPATDSPDVTVAMTGGPIEVLDYSLPAQVHGTVVKVRLQTFRDDGEYSEDSAVKTLTIDTAGPSSVAFADRWPGRVPQD